MKPPGNNESFKVWANCVGWITDGLYSTTKVEAWDPVLMCTSALAIGRVPENTSALVAWQRSRQPEGFLYS